MRLAALASELSGEWQTAMFLENQRTDRVPGDWNLNFDTSGVVSGTGKDVFGAFDVAGQARICIAASGILLTPGILDMADPRHCGFVRQLCSSVHFSSTTNRDMADASCHVIDRTM